MVSRHDDDRQDRSDLPPVGRRKVSRTTLGDLASIYPQLQQQQQTNGNFSDFNPKGLEVNGPSRIDRVRRYLEELDREIDSGKLYPRDDVLYTGRPKSPINRSRSLNESGICSRPRSVYVPGTSQTSEFDKYVAFKRNLTKDFITPRRGPSLNAYDRIKELREYRRSTSVPSESAPATVGPPPPSSQPSSVSYPPEDYHPKTDRSVPMTVLDKYLYGEPKEKKQSRFLKKEKDRNESRVDKTIKALRKNSVGISDEFSESKLLKRAVSLEDIHKETTRNIRASSLKPEGCEKPFKKKESTVKLKKGGVFETIKQTKKKPKEQLNEEELINGNHGDNSRVGGETNDNIDRHTRLANLKKLEFNKIDPSPESTPTGDFDEIRSCISQTDNSDTWSSSDHTERYFDLPANYLEDCVSERIRRKSFYHRFNLPRKNSYHRCSSNLERKRYY